MKTSFEKRCELLNYLMIATYDFEPYRSFREEEDLYIYSAAATHLELVTPGPVGKAHINRVFESWVYILGHQKDTGFDTIWDVDPNLPKFEVDEFLDEELKNNISGDPEIKIVWN